MRQIEAVVLEEWVRAAETGERCLPHEFLYRALRRPALQASFQIPVQDSWLFAAMERDLPMFVPG